MSLQTYVKNRVCLFISGLVGILAACSSCTEVSTDISNPCEACNSVIHVIRQINSVSYDPLIPFAPLQMNRQILPLHLVYETCILRDYLHSLILKRLILPHRRSLSPQANHLSPGLQSWHLELVDNTILLVTTIIWDIISVLGFHPLAHRRLSLPRCGLGII